MNHELCGRNVFQISDKTVTVYPASSQDRPVVYLNTFSGEGKRVYRALCNMGCRDFSLIAVSGLAWNHDMAPWDIPPISKGDTPCTGGADEYLQLLSEEIIPKAEKLIPGPVSWRGLAGYSLAGLFALYSIYHTELFSRIASMSGSLWFPGFEDYAISQEMKNPPEHLYLSLGDKECKTKNPYLKTVQEHTEAIYDFYKSKGIDTEFQLNPGGHYKNVDPRTVAGIAWILGR
ncbi:alpha/beta hydrolase-fold protein [Blautia schinkii]|nr:alpha/beta hydrolase-fold protein [Blautia schinkii]